MALESGSRLASYEILAPLGRGGMGEVWEARDTRLGRIVALKVLPPGLADDPHRLRRFESEARLASSLNHPNIVTIHEIGSEDGVTFLAMERVGGQSLRALLDSGPLPARRLFAIAAQIAEGLAAAHAAGVVHRDLKPENLMVGPSGLVKILDFGLAKLSATSGAGLSQVETAAVLTAAGTILGTASYMSPEQAAGQPVDFRSDQFSFGSIVYEMAAGHRPFSGATAPETLAAIIRTDPAPLGPLAPRVPAPLRWIVERCLAKEPDRRYASTLDLARDLATMRDHAAEVTAEPASSATENPPAPWTTPAPGRRKLFAAGFLGLALACGLAFVPAVRHALAPRTSPRATRVTQLTQAGREYAAAISPDGTTVAFRSEEEDGSADIFARQVSGGDPVRLTHDAAVETDLVYSPDGESLYYATGAEGLPAIWRVGALGGTPRKIVDGARYPSLSGDGKQIAWVRPRAGSNVTINRFGIEIASPDGAGARTLIEADGIQGLALSPDARSIAFADGTLFAPRTLKLLDVATGRVRPLTKPEDGNVYSMAWLPDGKRLVISTGTDRFPMATGLDLALVNADGSGVETFLPNVAARLAQPSVSRDGRRLVASMERYQLELWRAPITGDPEENGRNARLLLDSTWFPFWSQVSRDGKTVLFDSKAKGAWNLFTMPVDGSAPPRQVTFFTGNVVMHASLSPDGTHVAYASQQDGLAQIWVAAVDGSGARRLSNDAGPDYWPVWSHDGRFVLYSTSQGGAGAFRFKRVPVDGGLPEPLPGGHPGLRGDASPVDGRFVFWSANEIHLIDERGAELLELPGSAAMLWSLPVFSPDGRSFTFLRQERYANRAVWVHDTVSGEAKPLVRFPGRFEPVFRASWADEGRSVVVNRSHLSSNVVLVEGF